MLTQPGYQASCFASVLAFAFTLYNALRPDPCSKIIDTHKVQPEYDFIIIGAGSAGCVVANRLSEIADWNVLLLEAGGHETDFSDIPAFAPQVQNTPLDWQFLTEPPRDGQRYCLAMTNQSCKSPRGKAVGGSSVINSFQYLRGNKRDYDNWEAAGNTGWGYSNVLKYFLKSENNSNPSLLETPFHTCGGYQSVEDAAYTTSIAAAWIKAAEYIGYKHVDVNGKEQTGFTIPQATIRNGRRCSTSKAFIRPVQRRPNLNVSMHSYVTKIGLKDENALPKATTVYFVKENKEYSARAKKEVILSAGVINSPQILMLSGIGPKQHLMAHGIKLVKDLKVGYNLQDHVSSGATVFEVAKPVTVNLSAQQTPDAVAHYLLDGKGPLTSIGPVEGTAFVNSRYADPSGLYPDIQLVLEASTIYNSDNKSFGNELFNLRPDLFYGTGYERLADKYLLRIGTYLIHPKSRGRVMLRSKNPFHHPVIIPNTFAQGEDIAVFLDGVKIAFELIRTPPFKALGAAPVEIPFPGCETHTLFSDGYWECTARHFTYTSYHPTCTCPMGVGPDAVVDPQLRVHGVGGLRVIDASVMPNVVSGNTNGPAIMIGEKGADMVKAYWNARLEPLFGFTDRRDCNKRRREC